MAVIVLSLLGCGIAWRMPRGWRLLLPTIGGLIGGAWFGLQPTLFRAENGVLVSLVAFALPGAVVGLAIGAIARVLFPTRPVER